MAGGGQRVTAVDCRRARGSLPSCCHVGIHPLSHGLKVSHGLMLMSHACVPMSHGLMPHGHTRAVARTLSPSGSSWVFSTDTTESSVALSCSLLSTNFSLARLAASWCNSMHSCSLDRRSSSAIAPAPSSTCIMFFCRGARARQTRAEQRVLARRAAGGLRTCTLPCAICKGLARSASGGGRTTAEHADESGTRCARVRGSSHSVLRSAGGLNRPTPDWPRKVDATLP